MLTSSGLEKPSELSLLDSISRSYRMACAAHSKEDLTSFNRITWILFSFPSGRGRSVTSLFSGVPRHLFFGNRNGRFLPMKRGHTVPAGAFILYDSEGGGSSGCRSVSREIILSGERDLLLKDRRRGKRKSRRHCKRLSSLINEENGTSVSFAKYFRNSASSPAFVRFAVRVYDTGFGCFRFRSGALRSRSGRGCFT